ncbi:MAG TPA: protein phosphatase 2C domain-containing protein [Longimicrobiaceae bacterium]|jgi:protein phosphatase|nr:protein phosphatase 2C domain-containing protein [Longimicrobiaceae bacterium]
MGPIARVVATYTHAGRRHSNQDAVLATALPDGRFLLAVADGMGGHSAGEIASALAIETLHARVRAGDGLRAAFSAANAAVYREAAARPSARGMGTTLVALLQAGATFEIANVGDSRGYRVSEAGARSLTLDHSFVAEAVRSGSMSAAQAADSPWRNALTRAIGTEAVVQVDVFGPFPARDGEAVVLCSDGLYKSIKDDMIAEYLLATEDAEAAVQSLAALAFRRGSDDNISIAIAEYGELVRGRTEITLPISIARQLDVAAGR